MWTVVYIAQNKAMADGVRVALEERGVIVKVKRTAKSGDCCYQILVPEAEVEQAHNIIIDIEF